MVRRCMDILNISIRVSLVHHSSRLHNWNHRMFLITSCFLLYAKIWCCFARIPFTMVSNIAFRTLCANIVVILVRNQAVIAGHFVLMFKRGISQLASWRKIVLIFGQWAGASLTINRCPHFGISIKTRCTSAASASTKPKKYKNYSEDKRNFSIDWIMPTVRQLCYVCIGCIYSSLIHMFRHGHCMSTANKCPVAPLP